MGRVTVGQHGVGIKSLPAAGQVYLEVNTSTDTEAWRAVAGSLLSSEKICITPIEPWLCPGTRLSMRFKKRHGVVETRGHIERVLKAYCDYLPLTIRLTGPETATSVLLGKSLG